jgi:hypothetical protein
MLEGVCLAETVTLSGPWFQTAKRSQCLCVCVCVCVGVGVGVMDYHDWKSPSSLWSCMLIPHSILPNHTEGHGLNGRDALSRKAGLRLGKDSTGVGVKNLLSCDLWITSRTL